MSDANIRLYIDTLEDLATLPALMGKLLAVVGNENATTDDLHKVIAFDQALAQRILRVANSAAFGHSGNIRDLDQAILFLGFEKIKAIAVGMTVMTGFAQRGPFKMKNLWVHGYEVGFIAAALSDLIPLTLPGECFLAGLLHDVGRVLLAGKDPELFQQIGTNDAMLQMETTLFGCTHADAGALFAEKVRIPGDVAAIIRHHHRPSAARTHRETTCAVALAEALSRTFSPRSEDDGLWNEEHDDILRAFSISTEDLQGVHDKLTAAAPEIESFFG